ncbi:MAG: RluA family pseudouridine synthase [Verrucomicrobia bacterium]|nr:RluA family pseudouridine synthase [Verrucomicrobiota bacterium]
MPKTEFIELGDGEQIPILYEDRSVIAIDKPPGWMLVPVSWQKTDRNLHAAILSSIEERRFWARSRNLKFLQHVHRLDAETSGVLLMVKSQGAVRPFGRLFESRQMHKRYWAVCHGRPQRPDWDCRAPLAPDPAQIGRIKVDPRAGKPAETHFKLLCSSGSFSLIEAQPVTGRTHQIRVHAARSGTPIVGDRLYGPGITDLDGLDRFPLGLRSMWLEYANPFDGRPVRIMAAGEDFLAAFGFRIDPQGGFHSLSA